MFQEGKIKSYHEDRGFGFIQIEKESKDLFFHIKDFPNKNVPPKIGENLKFIIVEDAGKFKAVNIVRLDLKVSESAEQNNLRYRNIEGKVSSRDKKKSSWLNSKIITVLGLIIILGLSILVYKKYQEYQAQKQQKLEELMIAQQQNVAEQRAVHGELPELGLSEKGKKNLENVQENVEQALPVSSSSSEQFKCDGREHCSQMKSYEEALFFIRNCPNTKMDGDGDGIPCESQFR
ncbi:cold shock domain-containing protein [Acinetobacter indicus]|uniref:cold shock domain-containing protein n=1 Tax=Acinetobacter indicus TaxID=756892 RepID=UPI0013B09160|nr:cold shock domain-containing protein [Acinetobacter indicus]QIC72880.1 cold shock domain-containing protein [Acinetobacter indicus]